MFAIIIPGAFDLSSAVGEDAVYSGFLIGIMKFGVCLGCFVPWLCLNRDPGCWRTKSTLFLSCGFLLEILGASAYALVCLFITFGQASDARVGNQSAVLLCARLVHGIGSGIVSNTTRNQVAHLFPSSGRTSNVVWVMVAIAMGMGLGPMFASGAVALTGLVAGASIPTFASVAVVAVVFPVVSLLSLLIAPSLDLEVDHITEVSSETRLSVNEVSARGRIVIGCLVFEMIRGLSVSSLEAATALILEYRYHWSLQSIGLAVGGCFLFCPAWKVLLQQMAGHLVSLQSWPRFLMFLVILGATLMLYTGNALLLLGADSLLFPGFLLCGGIVQGILQQNCFPTGWLLDLNNTSIACHLVIDGFGRFIGPPLARWHVMRGGQFEYAGQQLLICATGWLFLEWMLWHTAQVRKEVTQHQGSEACVLPKVSSSTCVGQNPQDVDSQCVDQDIVTESADAEEPEESRIMMF